MWCRRVLLLGLILAFGRSQALAQSPTASGTLVYIGTQGENILGARLDTQTGHLTYLGAVAPITRPTWLAVDPNRPILYSVSEIGNYNQQIGNVLSFAIDPATGALKSIGLTTSGGHGPTYLSYDPRVNTLFVSHFGGGQVAAIPVGPDGTLKPPTSVVTDTGHGPNAKQLNPHAHGATLDPGGRFVLTPDMGADRVFVNKYDPRTGTLSPADPPFAETGPNTGPRHLVFSPDGRFVFVLTELSAEVRTFTWDSKAGRLRQVQSIAIDPPDFKGVRSAAEIRVSSDGRFVYVSNRTKNSMEVFAVDQSSGALTLVQEISSGGDTPRSFGIDPSGHWLVVTNQISNTLTVFAIDKATGKLASVGSPLAVGPTPVAIVFYQP